MQKAGTLSDHDREIVLLETSTYCKVPIPSIAGVHILNHAATAARSLAISVMFRMGDTNVGIAGFFHILPKTARAAHITVIKDEIRLRVQEKIYKAVLASLKEDTTPPPAKPFTIRWTRQGLRDEDRREIVAIVARHFGVSVEDMRRKQRASARLQADNARRRSVLCGVLMACNDTKKSIAAATNQCDTMVRYSLVRLFESPEHQQERDAILATFPAHLKVLYGDAPAPSKPIQPFTPRIGPVIPSLGRLSDQESADIRAYVASEILHTAGVPRMSNADQFRVLFLLGTYPDVLNVVVQETIDKGFKGHAAQIRIRAATFTRKRA